MIDLAPRQIQILRAIIEEFIQTAEPVGSETIDKKFNIGVSPATIRNEMVYLTDQGYLIKSHSSSGRIPTSLALKLYINELMREKELTVAEEVSAKEKIWKAKKDIQTLIQESVRLLADRSRALGIAMTEDNHLYHSGYANLLAMPEFYDIEVMRQVLNLIEQATTMEDIFDHGKSENPVQIVFGTELGNQILEPISLIYVSCHTGNQTCRLGVLGSNRFDYPYLIPMMRYFKNLIEEMAE